MYAQINYTLLPKSFGEERLKVLPPSSAAPASPRLASPGKQAEGRKAGAKPEGAGQLQGAQGVTLCLASGAFLPSLSAGPLLPYQDPLCLASGPYVS